KLLIEPNFKLFHCPEEKTEEGKALLNFFPEGKCPICHKMVNENVNDDSLVKIKLRNVHYTCQKSCFKCSKCGCDLSPADWVKFVIKYYCSKCTWELIENKGESRA
ncbi:Zinc finger, LIM-type, partial [Parasponia andersonii]